MKKNTFLRVIDEIPSIASDVYFCYPNQIIKVPFADHTYELVSTSGAIVIEIRNNSSIVIETLDLLTLVNISQIQPVGGNSNAIDVSLSTLSVNNTISSMPDQIHEVVAFPEVQVKLSTPTGTTIKHDVMLDYQSNAKQEIRLGVGSVLANDNRVEFTNSLSTDITGDLELNGELNIGLPENPNITIQAAKYFSWVSYLGTLSHPKGTITICFLYGSQLEFQFDNSSPAGVPTITVDPDGICRFLGFVDKVTGEKKYMAVDGHHVIGVSYSVEP